MGFFIFCRSRLAGESGTPGIIDAKCTAAFAGKPAPTRLCYSGAG
jgi:hypothetical protein